MGDDIGGLGGPDNDRRRVRFRRFRIRDDRPRSRSPVGGHDHRRTRDHRTRPGCPGQLRGPRPYYLHPSRRHCGRYRRFGHYHRSDHRRSDHRRGGCHYRRTSRNHRSGYLRRADHHCADHRCPDYHRSCYYHRPYYHLRPYYHRPYHHLRPDHHHCYDHYRNYYDRADHHYDHPSHYDHCYDHHHHYDHPPHHDHRCPPDDYCPRDDYDEENHPYYEEDYPSSSPSYDDHHEEDHPYHDDHHHPSHHNDHHPARAGGSGRPDGGVEPERREHVPVGLRHPPDFVRVLGGVVTDLSAGVARCRQTGGGIPGPGGCDRGGLESLL